MTASIRIDPTTGQKLFNTRAAKATEKIAGKGYSPVADTALKTLPDPPPGAKFNATEQAKYRANKEARRGAANYMAITGASPATATRDLTDLVENTALTRTGERRHARYSIPFPIRTITEVRIESDGTITQAVIR